MNVALILKEFHMKRELESKVLRSAEVIERICRFLFEIKNLHLKF